MFFLDTTAYQYEYVIDQERETVQQLCAKQYVVWPVRKENSPQRGLRSSPDLDPDLG